jgi:hypothetical protein
MNTAEMGRQPGPRVLARFLVGSETVIGNVVNSQLHGVVGRSWLYPRSARVSRPRDVLRTEIEDYMSMENTVS